MYKVKHAKLLQETNVQLVGIRQTEMQYYTNYFRTFGGVGAMIAGFLFGSLTQILGLYVNIPRWVKSVYWVCSTVSFLAGLHIMLSTTFCLMYGQGKALYGKAGSMTEVIAGFQEEQDGILWGFVIMFFFYGISIMGTCGLVYYQTEGIICSVLTGISMIFWYKDSMSIYYSLRWTEEDEIQKELEWKAAVQRETETEGKEIEEDNIARANRLMEKVSQTSVDFG